MMKYDVVIIGAGESGIGAALLAKKLNMKVFVSDFGNIKPVFKKELELNNIDFEQNGHSDFLLSTKLIIKSPGVPDNAPIIKKAKQKGIPVISEIEFAFRFTDAKMVCVTGSNGKTTTVNLIYEIFKQAGYNAALAGNVGTSLARLVASGQYDWFIVELSSFQLDNMFDFKADIAVLLNITPDHLDRYDYKFENYINSKFRIIANLTKNDFFIYNIDDEVITNKLKSLQTPANLLPFSIKKELEKGGFLKENFLNIKTDGIMKFNVKELQIKGKHNIYNSLAAGLAAKAAQIKDEHIRKAFRTFEGVEHRLEKFLKIRGITFINDSKATNVNSVAYALDSLNTPVVLILGGIDKGNDYSIIKPLVKEKVRAIVALGLDNHKIINEFSNIVPVYETKSMEEAVKQSYLLAHKGDTVLLSPACASFDLFENYEDRGKKFKQAVRNL